MADLMLSVVIPVYNEFNRLEAVLDRIKAVPLKKELIIVDDCSTDGTRELLKEKIEGATARVFYHEKNMGKGAALQTGFEHVTGDIVIIQDADLEYDPMEYGKVIKPIVDGKADVVYGSRFLASDCHGVVHFWHFLGNKFLTLLSNMFTDLNLSDMETCYKAFKREIIQGVRIQEKRFGFEPEITAKIAALHCRIYEVGVSYHGRTYEDGKKINWKDGIRAVYCILKYNLSSPGK